MKKKLQDRPYLSVQILTRMARLTKVIAILLFTCLQAVAGTHTARAPLTLKLKNALSGKTFNANVNKNIHGKVTDASGAPLEGVSVGVLGTTLGTLTNVKGEFSLSVPDNSTLTFSYLGFVSQKVEVKNRNQINVVLQQTNQTLSDVVVIGYGTQKKKDLSGSVASVNVNDINSQPINSIDQALEGRVSGVQVIQGAAPGQGATIRIRGVGTTGNNDPLWIIDGIATSPTDFNPGDVQSIDVLKDASATAIYGSRAANGVIIVTTKRGKAGNVKVNLDSYYGYQQLWKTLDVLNAQQFATLANRAYINSGLPTNPAWADPSSLTTTNWQKAVMQNGALQNYNFMVSGGNDKLRSALTLNYSNTDGSLISSNYNRYSVHLNNDYDVNKILKFGSSLEYTHSNTSGVPTNDVNSGILDQAVFMWPDQPVRKADGSFNILPTTANGLYYPLQFTNPVARQSLNSNSSINERFFGNVFGELEILPGLKFKSAFGADIGTGYATSFSDYYVTSPPNVLNTPYNTLNWSMSQGSTYTWDNTLNYTKIIGKHNFSVLAGSEAISGSGSLERLIGQNTPNNSIQVLSAASTILAPNDALGAGDAYSMSLLSYFGRVNYIYNDRYILQANIRADGTYKIAPNNRWGYFPSASAAWRISKEDFMQSFTFVDDLKIRGSYGETGNQNSIGYGAPKGIFDAANFPYLSLYSPPPGGVIFGTNQQVQPVLTLSNLGNPNLKWETQKMTNIGFDATLFNSSINITADYYNKLTDGLITQIPVPTFLDAPGNFYGSYETENSGSVRNNGVEVSVTYTNNKGDFKYNINANITTINNKVLSLGNGGAPIDELTYLTQQEFFTSRTAVGHPIGSFYGLETDGIYQTAADIPASMKGLVVPGDRRYKDLNGNGIIDAGDNTFIGSPIPKFIYGFTLGASYKGFDISTVLQGQYGNKILNALKSQLYSIHNFNGSGVENVAAEMINSWNGPGTSNTLPRIAYNSTTSNYLASDFYVEDGSFLRCRTLQLGYTLPTALAKRISFSRIRFYINAQNLFTLTKYTGFDPEISNNVALASGIDEGQYPVSKIFTMGVNLSL